MIPDSTPTLIREHHDSPALPATRVIYSMQSQLRCPAQPSSRSSGYPSVASRIIDVDETSCGPMTFFFSKSDHQPSVPNILYVLAPFGTQTFTMARNILTRIAKSLVAKGHRFLHHICHRITCSCALNANNVTDLEQQPPQTKSWDTTSR